MRVRRLGGVLRNVRGGSLLHVSERLRFCILARIIRQLRNLQGSSELAALFTAVVLCAAALPAQGQQTIHVPADQPTIQAGIDAAQNGDTVLVAPGTYKENIDFKGKAITVTSGATSSAGAATTIIQGQTPDPTVSMYVHDLSLVNEVLNGFTVTHAANIQTTDAATGNGIAVLAGNTTISNNLILDNPGCGLASWGSILLFQGNSVTSSSVGTCGPPPDPHVLMAAAGPVAVLGSGKLLNNRIINNHATSNSSLGVWITNANSVLLQNNIIAGNTGPGSPLIIAESGDKSLVQNLIYGNTSSDAKASAVNITNPSGGLGSLIMTNNTIVSPSNTGSALFLSAPIAQQAISNNIFVGQAAGQVVYCYYAPTNRGAPPNVPPASAIFSHNDVYQASTAQNYQCASPGNTIADISADPQFINLAAGNLHTQRTSPVVAAGDINAPLIPPTDLDGKSRTVCDTIDMGAYELQPQPGAPGNCNTNTLTASPNPATVGQTVTFTVTVQAAEGSIVPTGTVIFTDGSTSLDTATLGPAGKASFSTSTLAVGTHTITAGYAGDGNFGPSNSSVTETIVNPASSFTLTLAPPSITMHGGKQATVAINLSSVGAFAGPVTLSYGALPANLSASLSSPTVTLSAGGSGSALLLLNTQASPAGMALNGNAGHGSGGMTPIALGAILLTPLTLMRRRRLSALLIVFAGVFMAAAIGCTNSYYEANLVAPGTYTVPINATDSNGDIQTANFVLTIVP